MVIDSSALIAIVRHGPEGDAFIEAIGAAEIRLVGAPTMTEARMVTLGRLGEDALSDLRDFCVRGGLEIVPFGADHVELALDAFRRFGKGRHPAALNLGGCFAYALSRATGEPLLFKGEDFARTDVTPAAW